MSRILETWTVMPHGPVEEIDEGLLTVAGLIPMPLGKFPRRMTVVRLEDGTSAIFSAIALDEGGMARIEALGRPAFLIVPNDHHRMDAKIWKQRYPDLKILAPPGACKKVMEVVYVDATSDLLNDSEVRFLTVPGTGDREAAMEICRNGKLTIVVNDIIANVRHPPGIGAGIMARLMGFGVSAPQVPRVVKRVLIEDKEKLAGQLRTWAERSDVKRILPSHGDPIETDASGALRKLADALDS